LLPRKYIDNTNTTSAAITAKTGIHTYAASAASAAA
jgi:hypothetical protein